MKEILIDIETYSEVDIGKCGLYRYATDPSTEILLIAWATDEGSGFGETQCADIATGEPFLQELLEAFKDSSVKLIAHNAAFERVNFSCYLSQHYPGQYLEPGTFLSPDNWICTMVMAASLTLPLALKDVGAVLKTNQQKDKEGERLIKLFSMPCKPTKTNGMRTRNLPRHFPADWAKFKYYCIQDVNTEVDIYNRLKKFPMPPQEWEHYREAYFKAGSMNPATGVVFQYKPREGAEEMIYQRISDITISMKALDYLNMPDCVPTRYEVEMNTEERKLYDMLRQDLLIPLKDGDIDAANAASLTGKLLQMSNGAVYDENGKARIIHDHKLEALEDLIEAANGQPVLVAYWFKHDRQRIIEHLTHLKIPVRDIKSSTDIKDWNAGNIPVALIHPASAGHGLNIQQGGHILIWFGLTWSLELYQQTNARLWRQGQTQVVTIHHIITKDTVDEDVMAALEQKDMTQEKLISAVKARLGE